MSTAMPLWRIVNRALAPAGARGRLTVMIFHRVLDEPDPLMPTEPDARRFEARMRSIAQWFNVLPLDEAVERLQKRSLPSRALAITFDDGYADNVRIALPILARLRLPATFFIATAYLDGGAMWNDVVIEALRRHRGDTLDLSTLALGVASTRSVGGRRVAIDRLLAALKYEPRDRRDALARGIATIAGVAAPDLMMTRAQVRALADAGMGVGAHTHTHPILARLDASEAREDIATGRDALRAIVGRPVRLFAYPNGKPGRDYTDLHVRQASELGFTAAFSTASGVAAAGADQMQLPRFTPWDDGTWKFGARLSGNLMRARVETVSA